MEGTKASVSKKSEFNTRKNKRRKTKIRPSSFDFPVFFVVLLLVLFGVIMIFSSSYYYALTDSDFGDMYHFLRRQLCWAGIGFAAMIFMMNFDYKILKRFALLSYIFSIVCLVLVIFVGSELNGQKRWLGIGSTIGFQPSEVAKISVILFLALYISQNKNILKNFKGFLKCLGVLGIPCILIGATNLSTAIVVAGIGMVMIFVSSPKIWYFAVGAIPVGIAGVLAVSLKQFAYRFGRIQAWLDPFADPLGKGFQTIQSLYAVASGGLFGLGLGQSRQKTFIPEAYNDIIFAIICEELGLIGAIIVIMLFAILIWRGLKIAMNAIDVYGCLVATGIVAMIGSQAIINISVVTNTIPNTGMPLPFVSYGGSSLVFTMISMGILLNISKFQKDSE